MGKGLIYQEARADSSWGEKEVPTLCQESCQSSEQMTSKMHLLQNPTPHRKSPPSLLPTHLSRSVAAPQSTALAYALRWTSWLPPASSPVLPVRILGITSTERSNAVLHGLPLFARSFPGVLWKRFPQTGPGHRLVTSSATA